MFLIASIEQHDYAAFKRLCAELPDSFEDWSDQQVKEQQRCESQERDFLKVPVSSREFSNYCKASHKLPNLVSFRACVVANSAKARAAK